MEIAVFTPLEVLLPHAHARLMFPGRCLLVRGVRLGGRPVAHVAAERGVSRQCAHRWVRRFDAQGRAGLQDRSSGPHRAAGRAPAWVKDTVVTCRRAERRGAALIAEATGVPERTVSPILRRRGEPLLAACGPLTGQVIRASKTTVGYERDRPGELVHGDVKKPGKILPGEKGPAAAAFLLRAADWFAARGIPAIEPVITGNAVACRKSTQFRDADTALGARHKLIRPHCPWQNGTVGRSNRTPATEWAYRQVVTSNTERTGAPQPWLEFCNTRRRPTAPGGPPPASRLSPSS